MKKVTKTESVKKVTKANAVKKVKVEAPRVTLTLKQAQAIETLLVKLGKTSKVLSNKIASFNA